MDKPFVYVQLTHPKAQVPVYAKDGDAGADVRVVPNADDHLPVPEDVCCVDEKRAVRPVEQGDYVIPPGQTVMLDLGLRIELPDGWEMQVRSRSGMAKCGLVVANSPGTIDSGYRGPCMVLLHNNTNFWRVIKPGVRVAQFVLKRAPQAVFVPTAELNSSERGEGGFGSTGTQ